MFFGGVFGLALVLVVLVVGRRQYGILAMFCWALAGPMLGFGILAALIGGEVYSTFALMLLMFGVLVLILGFVVKKPYQQFEREQWAAQAAQRQRYQAWQEVYNLPADEHEYAQRMSATFEQRHPRVQRVRPSWRSRTYY